MGWAMNNHKYTFRKLGLIAFLAALVYSPFGVAAYKSATTKDPFILMAREIEAFPVGGIDVLHVGEIPSGQISNGLRVLVYIPNFPDWSERGETENFKRMILAMTREREYDNLLISIGWDYPVKQMAVQGTWTCLDLRATIDPCVWDLKTFAVPAVFVKWPGIGKP